ncbi:ABC transporter family substrate-binding protein [Nocardiopsis sp. CNT312]|uniref:ABC transporter family substrate-binding protein n=1 Tax=Nocardiopsis sp. CNT312 TaxID=1137268 RepID=UPI00048CBCFC|nr:ABC transporter family substrate-binding protein [Nocardiopsis sp. CNT312]
MHRSRKTLALAAAGTSAMMALTACAGGADPAEEVRQITWVINNVPSQWASTSGAGGSVYTVQMLSGVVPNTGTYLPNGEYEFNMDVLAEEPVLINGDLDEGPFQYSFTLHEDAVWNDGTPMTAEDLRVTVMMTASPSEGYCTTCDPRGSATEDMIDTMEVDGKTLTVTLKEGMADPEWTSLFDFASAGAGFYPSHLAEENGWDVEDPDQLGEFYTWLHDTRPEWSGGPFQIVDGDLTNQVVKEPNPEWWGAETQVDRIIHPFNTEEGTFVTAFANGEIDGANPAQYSEDVILGLQDLPGATVTVAEGSTWEHIDLNTENEWLADVELRRAIFTAIDRADIAERLYGTGYPDYELKNNHIFNSDSEYYTDYIGETAQGTGDTEAAIEILEEAGYELDGDTLTLDGEQVGPLRLRTTDTDIRSTSVQLVQSHLAAIGIEANIEMSDDLGGDLTEADYDIFQFGWSGSPYFAGSAHQFWHSESGSNFGSISNEDIDAAAEAANSAPTLDEAAEYSNEAVELVVQEAYVLPILADPNYFFASDRVAGIEDNLFSSFRATYNIGEWALAE